MKFLRSIESKHGVELPGYEPPVEEEPTFSDDEPFGALEIIGSFVFPIAGIVFAIMRFADEEIGPGLACLLIGALGFVCWWILFFLVI